MFRLLILIRFQDHLAISNYFDYLNFALQNWAHFEYKDTLKSDNELISGLFWFPVIKVISETDIRNWLSLAKSIKTTLGFEPLTGTISETAVAVICSQIASLNLEELDNGDWNLSKTRKLNLLKDFFYEHQLENLSALVYREILHQQYLAFTNIDKIINEVQAQIPNYCNDVSKFLLTGYIGKQLFKVDKLAEAKDWLNQALAYKCIEQVDYVDLLLTTAVLYSGEDKNSSIQYCQTAVEATKQKTNFVLYESLLSLGELAVAYWLNDDLQNSFKTFEILVDDLYRSKAKHFDANWIKMFLLTGHCTGYISSMIKTGEPPIKDGEPFFTPYQGMFITDRPDLSKNYEPANDAMVLAQMAFFADALHDPQKAYEWSLRGFDTVRESNNDRSILMISSTCSQYAVINFQPDEAFESYLLFAAVSSHLGGEPATKYNRLRELSLNELLTKKPSKYWDAAEQTTVAVAIIPLFIMVLTSGINNETIFKERKDRYLYMLKNYLPDASDKLLWDLVYELSYKIVEKKISISHLMTRANTFAEQEKRPLQIICILGIAYISKNEEETFVALINTIPYLQNAYAATDSINRFVIVPFVRTYSHILVDLTFVGSKKEILAIKAEIDQVDTSDPNAIQKVLHPAAKVIDTKLPEDRERWLYNFENIK
jgi:hypothetical protein